MNRNARLSRETDVLVVGTGYLGKRVALKSAQLGYRVYATTRSRTRLDELHREGFQPFQVDWNDSRTLATVAKSNFARNLRVLVAVSYDSQSRFARYESQVVGLRRLLQVLPDDAKICYISTTGVYHQNGGVWVDETSPTFPPRDAARVHLQAEQELHRQRPFGHWRVLRLAGIYGPGRVPRAKDVIAGRPVDANPKSFLNLIHVDDATRAVLASWESMGMDDVCRPSMQHRLFLIADDAPVSRGNFYQEIARRYHAAPPKFVTPNERTNPRRRTGTNKRVCNWKMRQQLLPTLDYPDYLCGLASSLS